MAHTDQIKHCVPKKRIDEKLNTNNRPKTNK